MKNELASAKTTAQCRTCRHWSPLFTGEAWGLRSFADAPTDVQADITNRLTAQMAEDGDADPYPALESHSGITYKAYSGANDIPKGPDWPFWGECQRTELSDSGAGNSLAMAIDGSMYRAILRCRCNFGCVQWEALQDV